MPGPTPRRRLLHVPPEVTLYAQRVLVAHPRAEEAAAVVGVGRTGFLRVAAGVETDPVTLATCRDAMLSRRGLR